jgi:hypothetical protein
MVLIQLLLPTTGVVHSDAMTPLAETRRELAEPAGVLAEQHRKTAEPGSARNAWEY